MRRFCPKCGITIEKGTFCDKCMPKTFEYEPPLIQVSEFSRVWGKKSWTHFDDLEFLISARVQEALGKKVPIRIEPFEFDFKKKEKLEIKCYADIDGQEIELIAKLMYRQCDMGEKQKSNYFEGILQLRNPNDKVVEYIDKEMQKVAKKGIAITKTSELKNGVDLYFTNKNYIKILAQKLHKIFGAKVDINSQLFSHNHLTSKDIYRINVLVTFPKYNLGDVISFNYQHRNKNRDCYILVKKFGRLITGVDLITGKDVSFEMKSLENAEKIEEFETKVINLNPLSVLNPKTYQEEVIANSLVKDLDIDDDVVVVMTKMGTFVVGYPFISCEE
ncbi:MAG: NMD3-related protein [Candidatus Woesearchaeota archaeon]